MGVNKVQANGEVYIDLTKDSVTPETLFYGVTTHDASGEEITGTYIPPIHAEGQDKFPNEKYLIYGDTLTSITDKMRELTQYNGDIGENDPIKPEEIPEMLPFIRADGYSEGYNDGYDEGHDYGFDEGYSKGQTLGVLCDWTIMSNSQSCPIVTIINHHPSYYLHCGIYEMNAYGDDNWRFDVVVPPDDSVSETFDFSMNAEAYIGVYDVRWSKNA